MLKKKVLVLHRIVHLPSVGHYATLLSVAGEKSQAHEVIFLEQNHMFFWTFSLSLTATADTGVFTLAGRL